MNKKRWKRVFREIKYLIKEYVKAICSCIVIYTLGLIVIALFGFILSTFFNIIF